MYSPAEHETTALAKTVFEVTLQMLDTYCVLFGAEQAVHELPLLIVNVYVLPAAHGLHKPLTPPPALTVPWTYAVLMRSPAAHAVTADARPVSEVTVHALVTYCVLFGAVQAVHELALFAVDVNMLPAVHAVHTPSVPVAAASPAA